MERDQAQGLRRWAEAQQQPRTQATDQPAASAPPREALHTLLVVGLPDTSSAQTQRVRDVLARWSESGRGWVGHPETWRIIPLATASPHLPLLSQQQPRWGLWVDSDPAAFRRAHDVLKALRDNQGPRRLVVLHPLPATRGLVSNLQQMAKAFFGIDLLVVAA